MTDVIKYDRHGQRLAFRAALACAVLALLAAYMVMVPDSPLDYVSDYAAVIVMCAFIFLPVVSVALWVYGLNAYFYIRRLRRYGYEVPENKHIYHRRLSELPHDDDNKYDSCVEIRESRILSYTACAFGCIIFFESVILGIHVQKLGSIAWLFDVCMFVVCMLWFIAALVYRRQMRPDLYRDDVDVRASGKTRQNIVMGLFSIVLGAFVSEMLFYMMRTAADFI